MSQTSCQTALPRYVSSNTLSRDPTSNISPSLVPEDYHHILQFSIPPLFSSLSLICFFPSCVHAIYASNHLSYRHMIFRHQTVRRISYTYGQTSPPMAGKLPACPPWAELLYPAIIQSPKSNHQTSFWLLESGSWLFRVPRVLWVIQDSNLGPRHYQCRALTN